MATTFQLLVCPMCGKTTKLDARKAGTPTYKAGDPQKFFIIQTRLCAGRHGLPKIDETNFIENLDDPELVDLANQLVDMASGLVISALENELPLHRPAILLRLDKLIEENKQLQDRSLPTLDARQTEKLTFDLQDTKKDLLIVIDRCKEAEKQTEIITLSKAHLQRIVDKMKEEQEEDNRDDTILEQGAEIAELKKTIENLQLDIKDYEAKLLSL